MKDSQEKIYGLRKQIKHYFEQQAEIILRDSQAASALTTHAGLYGLAGEESLRKFLRNHLPGRYGVGTGHIVSYTETSAQTDAIIYDARECFKIPITEESALFSVEGVYAGVEIKTSPTHQKSMNDVIETAVKNVEKIHETSFFGNFSTQSEAPVTSLHEFNLLRNEGSTFFSLYHPVTAIVILGTGMKFSKSTRVFREKQEKIPKQLNRPNLFCVIDEENYGLCGFDWDFERKSEAQVFWEEPCDSPGQTLALFLYWLIHKMTFNRVIERPIIAKQDMNAVWPSVLAPIVPRIHVDVSESGHERSWPWLNDTRIFDTLIN